MTDALRIAEQRLRSQGPSQARVAEALHILNEWYQEEQDGYRNRHNGYFKEHLGLYDTMAATQTDYMTSVGWFLKEQPRLSDAEPVGK
jgi:hypothetical protein